MSKKIVLVGAGNVGTATAFALMGLETISEIGIIDIDESKAWGEALDLSDGLSFLRPMDINAGDYSLCQNADLIIVSAGANQKVGETRLDLAEKNQAIFDEVISKILLYNPHPLLLITTNPVDVLTYYTIKKFHLSPQRVIGSGTVLDTSRLRHLLSQNCHVDPRNIHGYVIGEHGDGAVIVWSASQIAGIPLEKFCHTCLEACSSRDKLHYEVTQAAYRIIEKKGATSHSIALALKRITEALLQNEHSILTVSTLIEDYYGINDVCLSLPAIVNGEGIEKVLPLPLSEEEMYQLKNTAQKLSTVQDKLSFVVT